MNRQEFVAELLSALGGRVSTDETVQLTVAGSSYSLPHEWIYRAERRIAAKHDFQVLSAVTVQNIVEDDYYSILSEDTKSVTGVRLIDGTNSYELSYRSPMWFDLNRPYPQGCANGKPSVYTVTKYREYSLISDSITEYKGYYILLFDPVSDSSYKLYITSTMWPTKMTTDTETSSFGENFLDHIILEYAIGFGFLHFGEAYKKDATYHNMMGDKFLEEMIAADTYVPANRVAPEGYSSTRKRYSKYALDSGSVPNGVANPWR